MLRIIHNQSKTVTGAAVIIAAATLTNKGVGIIRDRVIAHYFGTGPVTDAYYAAFKIPDLIYGLLVVGALSAGFIPVFTKLYNQTSKEAAWKLASNAANIIGLALVFVCSLGAILATPLARLITPGFSPESAALVAPFMRVMFISPLALGLSMVAGGILQSLRSFVIFSVAPIFYNIGIIIGAWIFRPILGPIGLAWGVVLGAFLHFAIQFYSVQTAGYRWKWTLDLKDRALRQIGKMLVPRTMGLAVSNVNVIITTALASLLPAGTVAAYNFADNLQWVPIGVFGISYSLAAFPAMSAAVAGQKHEDFIRYFASTARQIIFFIVPASILFLLLRAQIVRVILGSGEFDWTATINTANALAFFSLGMFAQALIPLLARAFYALSDSKTPFIVAVISGLINIIASLIFMRSLGIAGLALAASIGALVNLSLLFFTLRQKTGDLEEEKTASSVLRIAIAALFMAIVIQILKYPLAKIFNQDYFWGIFGQGAVAGTAGLAIYVGLCYALKLPELNQFIQSFKKKWGGLQNATPEEIDHV